MSASRCAAADTLAAIYGQLTDVAQSLTDASAMLPSRCAGWAVIDVLFHQLPDVRRALVTFATPAAEPPDTDEVSYWRPFSASAGGPASPGSEGAGRSEGHRAIAHDARGLRRIRATCQEPAAPRLTAHVRAAAGS